MGYTHYFSRAKDATDKNWMKFTDEVRAILAHPAVSDLVCEEYTKPEAPPVINGTEVRFNGKGKDGHETFYLPRAAHKECCKTGGPSQVTFCGSWGKHYDIAVSSVLLSAKRHLREDIESDGDWSEDSWLRARTLYAHVTSRIVPCPWPQKACSQCGKIFKRQGHAWGGHKICSKCGKGSYTSSYLGTVCMNCNALNSFKLGKPKTWCWYCSNGYKDKHDAAEDLTKRWAVLTEELKKLALKKRLRHE